MSDSVADAVVELYTTHRILFLQCKLVLENRECEMILQHFSAAVVELYTNSHILVIAVQASVKN